MTTTPVRRRGLTEGAVLAAIRAHWATKGYPPPRRDLLDATGHNSMSTLARTVKALADAGAIRLEDGRILLGE